ncbi:hypothetical protein [Mycobacteroides salmoniphilum]|uniref:Uncharacterized protein n=1 Tax=Mycobacteroides salmoniphilum TaxID=404941 RepID=A0A4V3I194_9MYCO|nr:hypothetical protein [Mycobacteroides salmoniphilum]TDZ92422.1 hypothetical protein CCUG62472_03028 [Mycobacteroides salmoniphilum]TEA08247.1 hypothetical protein CCUG60884_00728 [Mycobacteroides salmoniphilum]
MIDITDALAGIVSDFESTLDQLRDEADAARDEILPGEQVPATTAKSVHEFRMPTQIHVNESDFGEDDVYRWQRWRR